MSRLHQPQVTKSAVVASVAPSGVKQQLICRIDSPRSPLYHPLTTRRELLATSGALLTSLLITPQRAVAVAETESPAIDIATSINLVATVGTLSGDNFTALASGVVWTSQGHVVTAYSPVNGALRQQQNLVIAMQNPSTGTVTYTNVNSVVAREPSLDLIVLQADVNDSSPSLPTSSLVVSSSKDLKIGQDVFLIGSSPDGSRTLSAGVLSATNRSIPAPNGQAIRGALQTDVNVTALGLGGALVDSKGHLIGIPTVSYSKPGTARSSGVNFALPSDTLVDAVPKLIAYGNLSGRR